MSLENNVSGSTAVDVARTDEQNVGGSGHDYRRLEERSEGFLQFYAASVAAGDCDPALWLMSYLNERYEYSVEERLWFSWLYHTYNLPTAFVYKNEFPDEELASVGRFTGWNNENYARLRYQTDTKWSKGHLPVMYQSYTDWVGTSTQHDKFTQLCQGEPAENFERLWAVVKGEWYKFGRYTAFFYLQTLKHTCGVKIDCPSLLLSDYSGSKSHRNGLCYALGKDNWVNEKLTAGEYQWLEDAGAELLSEARRRWPLLAPMFDNFSMETALCAYKKLWRVKRGRYVGYYLDRQSEEVAKAEKDNWEGIEWNVIWQAREEVVGAKLAPRYAKEDKAKMELFLNEGTIHYHYAAN
jgi:hypothetical protein